MRPRSEVWNLFDTRHVNGKTEATCKYCKTIYHNALASRLQDHLVKCTLCPLSVKQVASNNLSQPQVKRAKIDMSQVNLLHAIEVLSRPSSSSAPTQSPTPSESSSNELTTNPPQLTSSGHTDTHITTDSEIDEAVARAIFASGVPLSMLHSKYWWDAFQKMRPGYEPPTHHLLSGPLLTAEYQRLQTFVANKIESSSVLALISDGWTDVTGNVVNFIVTTPEPIFYKSVRPGEQRETAQYISSKIIEVIGEIGDERFVAVVTDNALNMQAAWEIVEEQYKHISCIGCAGHIINLLIKDIMSMKILQERFHLAKKIVKFFQFSHVPHALLESKRKEKYGSASVTLKLPSPTRFAGTPICFDSLLKNKDAILETIVCPTVHCDKTLKVSVLADKTWQEFYDAWRLLQTMSDAIIKVEADSAVLSDVHELFSNISMEVEIVLQECTTLSPADKLAIKDAVMERQKFACKPIHAAANLLDPRYKGEILSVEEESQALHFIASMSNLLGYDSGEMMGNLALFRAAEGFFTQDGLWAAAKYVSPSTWWKGLCTKQPLCSLASRILNVPPSSAASERNWSAHGRIHTSLKNRLSPATTEKLVYIQWNLRHMTGTEIIRTSQSSCEDESD